jgi:hypothetical protein
MWADDVVEFGFGIEVEHLDNMRSIVLDNGEFVKEFRGEFAWSNAERYAYDMTVKLQYA